MRKKIEKLLQRIEKEADKKYIIPLLALIAFTESIILPIPVDIFTFSLAAVQRKKWKIFGFVASIFSVLGALVGYIIGFYFFRSFGEKLIHFYHYEESFRHIVELFQQNTFSIMFSSAFTPIPFKVFTLAAGFVKASFPPFILASLVGRSSRFFLEVYLAQKYGKQITAHFVRRFNFYTLILAVLILVYIFFF